MRKHIIITLALICSSMCLAQTNTANSYIDQVVKHIDNRDIEEAMTTLNLAIYEMPDSVTLYDMRGILLEAFRLYDEAIEDFTLGIEKTSDPKIKSHFLSNRGGTKYRIRDFDGSYKDLTEALKLDSTNIDALNNLAAVCDEVNKTEEAFKYLYQIIQVDSSYVPAYINLGFQYQAINNHKQAIEYFDKAIELAPDEPLGYSNRSFSKLKIGDTQGAMKDINRSIKIFPPNSYAYKIRALILIENNKLEEACEDLTKADELGYLGQYGEEVNKLREQYCE